MELCLLGASRKPFSMMYSCVSPGSRWTASYGALEGPNPTRVFCHFSSGSKPRAVTQPASIFIYYLGAEGFAEVRVGMLG